MPNTVPATGKAVALPSQLFDLSRASGYGWRAVYDALTMVIQGVEGITQQPRCADGPHHQYNAAGHYLDAFAEGVIDARSQLVEELKAWRPESIKDWEARDEILLLDYVASIDGNLPDAAAYVLSLHAERAEHFREMHS